MLTSWIDTPEDNWPSLLPPKLLVVALDIFEKILPDAIESMFLEGMNIRLGT